MSETDEPISLKLNPALWRIRLVDDLLTPKMIRNINVSGPASVRGAIDTATHGVGWTDFKKQYPKCAIMSVEFAGVIDNQ